MGWQKRLDEEEKRLKKMEADLLCANKLSKRKNSTQDLLNASLEMVKSIDRSLEVLQNVEVTNEDETVNVSGHKMNKLWHRLTGIREEKFENEKKFDLSKRDLAKFYEEAKDRVLESDLKMLLDTSVIAVEKIPEEVPTKDVPSNPTSSEIDTMNSIENIETEEEFAGSSYHQPETLTASTENDDELQQLMANQMKVFVTSSPPAASHQQQQLIVNDQTFQVQDGAKLHGGESSTREIMTNIHDESTSTIDVAEDMDLVDEEEESSPIHTEPIYSIELSAVDREGSIIPEEVSPAYSKVQVTDMDEESDEDNEAADKMIEDISFPNVEISMNESAHDLSTITECTEYEQPSSEPISSEIVASSSSSGERVNSEIEQRLISINDSLELVDQAFEKVALVQTPSTDATYSTDKDFVSESHMSQNLLILSPPPPPLMGSSESSSSQITTSTPKVLMPDVINDVETKLERTDGQ
jgi:hypothetical protein